MNFTGTAARDGGLLYNYSKSEEERRRDTLSALSNYTKAMNSQSRAAKSAASRLTSAARSSQNPALRATAAPSKANSPDLLTRIGATLADVGASLGYGIARAGEGVLDAGASLIAGGAELFGMDDASRSLQDWAKESLVGDYMTDFGGQALVDAGSFLGEGKAGNIVRSVSSALGGMLPSVAVSLLATPAAGLTVLGVSAAGSGVEDSLQDGANLGQAMLYGGAKGLVEVGVEKLTGGMSKAFGGGWLDDVASSVLKTGAGRVAKDMAGEAMEEGISELVDPALKSIYKGVDAFSEYGEGDYWQGVGEAALVGGLTSAAFGGTVGHMMGNTGAKADVNSLMEDVAKQNERRTTLYCEGQMREGDVNDQRTAAALLDDYTRLQAALQKVKPEARAKLISSYGLSDVVNQDGSVRDEVFASLQFDTADGQTVAQNQNAPQSENTGSAAAQNYTSPGLWRKGAKVENDLSQISRDLGAQIGGEQAVTLRQEALSEGAAESYDAFRRAASKLSLESGSRMQFALVDAPDVMKGVRRGDTVYLNAKTLENGEWAGVLLEEAAHFTQGTKEAAAYMDFLAKDDNLIDGIMDELTKEGNAYGFTDENVLGDRKEEFDRELYAHASSKMLNTPDYVERLVRADRTLAEKLKNRITDVAQTLRGLGTKNIEIRKQLRRANKAVQMFESALGKAEPLTRMDDEEEQDGGSAEFSFVEPFVDDSGTIFENAILLDTNFFDNVSPRNWGRKLKNYVETRSTTNPVIMPVLDENGNKQELRFARKQERVLKNGGGKHQALSELYKTSDNISKLSVLHIDEIVEVSEENNPYHTGENSHGWLDKNGWLHRNANVINAKTGAIYNITMDIAKTDDGRLVLYATKGKIKRVGQAKVNSLKVRGSTPDSNSNNSIPQNPKMSTPKSEFSLENFANNENRSENAANQQTAEDIGERSEGVLAMLREPRVQLTEAQKAKAAAEYGGDFNRWRKRLFESVNIVREGTSLVDLWAEWREKYPDVFPDVSEEEMPRELMRIFNEAKESRLTSEQREVRKTKQEKMALKEELKDTQKELHETEEREKARLTLAKHIEDGVSHLATKSNTTTSRFFSPATYRSDQTKIVFTELNKIDYSSANTGSVREHIKTLAEWYGAKENDVFADTFERNPDIQAILDGIAGEAQGKALSNQELEALAKVVSHFRAISDLMQTVVKGDERTEAQPLAKGMVDTVNANSRSVTTVVRHARAMLGGKKNVNYWTLFGRPETVAKLADNFADGFFTYIFNEGQIAEVKRDKLRITLARDVERYLSKNGKYLGRLEKGEVEFRGEKITVAEAVQLYLLLGRPQAQVHLAVGGFETYQNDKRVKHAPIADFTYALSDVPSDVVVADAAAACEKARAELAGVLTAQDMEFAELLREKYNGAMKKAKIKGDEQKQGYSNVEQGEQYVPMMIAQKAETADLSYAYQEKVDRYAFNKQVYQLASNALLIMPAHKVFARHAMDLATYVEIRPVVESFNILYNLDINDNRRDPSTLKSTIERRGGFEQKAVQYMKDMLADLQGDRRTDQRAEGLNAALGRVRGTYALSTLAFNFNSWLSQLSSYLAAGSELDAGAMAKAAALWSKKGVADALIDQYSDVAMVRAYEGYATKAQTLLDKTSAPASKLMGITSALDRFVVRRLWAASLVQVTGSVQAAQNATQAQLREAGALLDRVILKTQQNAMATTRSGAMRSSSELAKALTMFSADNMMGFGQAIDAVLEVATLKRQKVLALENAKTDAERAAITKEYDAKIKEASKRARKAMTSMATSAIYLAVVSMILQALRGTLKDDEDESVAEIFFVTALGNALGGLPVIRDAYSLFFEGYDMDMFAVEAFNNMCGSAKDMALLLGDVMAGKDVEAQEVARKTRSLLYAIGTMTGIPMRNVYNNVRTVVGVIGLFDERVPYNVDNVFYAQSYPKDLEKALERGDDKMVDNIVGLMIGKNGDGMTEGTSRAVSKLLKAGQEGILPRSVPEVLVDAEDNEIELTKKQRQQFEKIYSAAYRAASDLVRLGYFKAATEEQQARALKFIWDTYYQLAKDTVLGEDSQKKSVLFAEAIPVERLALIVAQASEIRADVDKNGKTVSGSRLKKIEALVASMHLSAAQKYMVMGYLGYTNKNGRELVERYIRTLNLSAVERAELLEYSGYKEK